MELERNGKKPLFLFFFDNQVQKEFNSKQAGKQATEPSGYTTNFVAANHKPQEDKKLKTEEPPLESKPL